MHLVLPMWNNIAQGLNHAVIQISDTASQLLLIKNSHGPKGDLLEELYVEGDLGLQQYHRATAPFTVTSPSMTLSQPCDLESLTSAC